jgi:Fe-S cluster biogenesis protein NfuA|tara:strand:- start:193 stop:405 length:213 start_codon:yes stop_codon:yes gene_type:complete
MKNKVEIAIKDVRNDLMAKGGDIEFVSCYDGIVKLRIIGDCGYNCSTVARAKTGLAIKTMLPEIKKVEFI